MNQSRIVLKPGCEIIAVEVPPISDNFKLRDWDGKPTFTYLDGGISNLATKHYVEVPTSNGAILGRFTELSEEQCAMLVETENSPLIDERGYIWPKMILKNFLEANDIDPDKALIIKVNQ